MIANLWTRKDGPMPKRNIAEASLPSLHQNLIARPVIKRDGPQRRRTGARNTQSSLPLLSLSSLHHQNLIASQEIKRDGQQRRRLGARRILSNHLTYLNVDLYHIYAGMARNGVAGKVLFPIVIQYLYQNTIARTLKVRNPGQQHKRNFAKTQQNL